MTQITDPQEFAANNRRPDRAKICAAHPFRGLRTPNRCSLFGWVLPALLLVSLVQGIPGCASEPKSDRDWKSEAREVLGSGDGSRPRAGSGAPDSLPSGWSIVLEGFSGPRAPERAQARAAEVSNLLGRQDVSVRQTRSGAAVVLGLYRRPDERQAQADLAMARAFRSGNTTPFATAFLAPPPEQVDLGDAPELNLASARRSFGPRAAYTLQIGVYEAQNRDAAKRAAEEAAARLRRDGELAFYYHGSTRSSVTVGVFTDADFDDQLRPTNPTMIALQQRYPLNLLNGQYPIVERVGEDTRRQPSTLVRIP